ncbi:hypothetical protein HMPREF1396_00230 [Helicobacter pylori GAM114Ai]|nr:hypothetical protein HMPREF1396_00230 [Helicobacter pylori GAM114Ai]
MLKTIIFILFNKIFKAFFTIKKILQKASDNLYKKTFFKGF